MEIAPGIHLIDGIFPSNAYLIVDGGPILVDTGPPGNCTRIVRHMESLGYRRRNLAAVVLTHFHIDHMGSARAVAGSTGAEIWAHHLDAPAIEGKKPARWDERYFQLLTHAVTRLGRVGVNRRLEEGDTIECLGGLRVIHTPGHTEGSICLYQPERGVLFSGDTVQYSFGRVREPLGMFCYDSVRLVESIQRIASLDFECMLPGDGVPLIGSAGSKVREFVRNSYRGRRA